MEAHTSYDFDAVAGDKLDALLALGRHVVDWVVVSVIGGGVLLVVMAQQGQLDSEYGVVDVCLMEVFSV